MTERYGDTAAGRRPRAMLRWPFGRADRSRVARVWQVTYWVLASTVSVVWVGPFLTVIHTAGKDAPPVPLVAAWSLALGVFTVLYVRIVRAAMAGRWARGPIVAAALVVLVLLIGGDPMPLSWALLAAAWAAVAVLGMSRSATVLTCAATAVVAPVVASRGLPDLPVLTLTALLCVVLPWANRFQLWLWEVVRAAEQGREAQARLAVTEERLRFARDLHDLVGHSLTAIAVKSEVAVKLAAADAARAAAEMTEVRGLAREALREIRAAVRGYRTVDLDAELRSVRDVLEAGGIRCEVATEPSADAETGPGAVPGGLPQEVRTLLAWVVREGATNVLRHSRATLCRIALTVRDGRVVLEMSNDGAWPAAGPPEPAAAAGPGLGGDDEERGSGLAGLAERVASAGGVLTAGPDGPGRFRLSAAIPLRGAA